MGVLDVLGFFVEADLLAEGLAKGLLAGCQFFWAFIGNSFVFVDLLVSKFCEDSTLVFSKGLFDG